MEIPGKEFIARELLEVEESLREPLKYEIPLVQESAKVVLDAGGKRLRPILLLLSAKNFGVIKKETIRVAAVMELVHVASLLHDDVIDNSRSRRGRVSVNAHWGNKISVLLADFLLTKSLSVLCTEEYLRVLQIISRATSEMAVGQMAEIQFQNDFSINTEDYLKIINQKTASLISACCTAGGILGGATEEEIHYLTEYGKNLGMAFQIADDCLDFWGNEKTLGKPTGGDLAEKKFTLPLIYTLEKSSPEELSFIKEMLGNGKLTRSSFKKIRLIMEKHEAHQYAISFAEDYCSLACRALENIRRSSASEYLHAITEYVMHRQS